MQHLLLQLVSAPLKCSLLLSWNTCHPPLVSAVQVDAPPVSDGDYLTAWHMLVLPVVAEFRPDLVLVSAGFAAVDKDPLGMLGGQKAG